MAATHFGADAFPAPQQADVPWADLPHELLVRIFASQPEPLHNLGAELTCRAWARAVREAPVRHMTLLADSDAAAEQHARLLSRRPALRAATLLRWFEWEGCDCDAFPWQRLHLLQAQGRDRATHDLVDNLAAGLRSLVIGEFTLASGTVRRLDRLTALSSLTLQTASHNAAMLADLSDLHWLPGLMDLRLLHHREPGLPTAPVLMERLPERLTSLCMQDWGCRATEQSLNGLLAGLTALRSLSLVGCCLKTVMPGGDWIRVLRRASELQLCGGTLTAYALDYLLSNGTVGERDYSHEPWRTHTLRLTPQFACLVSGNLAEDSANAQHGQSATFTVPASVQTLHLQSAGDRRETKLRPILAAAPLQELNIDLDAWDAAVLRVSNDMCQQMRKMLSPRISGVDLRIKCGRGLLQTPLTSVFGGWSDKLHGQVVSLTLEQVALQGNLAVLSHILRGFSRVRHVDFRSRTPQFQPTPDGGPFALDEPPSMRTLTLELCTQPTVDLSGCVNLRALNLTLWKTGENATGPALPQHLTALTVLVMAAASRDSVTAPLPQLTRLPALRRLDLRFRLGADGPESGSHAVLPTLPTGLTHLTMGMHQDRKEFLTEDACLFGQEQLTRLTELRELVVLTPRPLEDVGALRRLPLLVNMCRTHHGPEGGCGLRYAPDLHSRPGAADAPVFFPDGFDGHGYAP